MMCKIVTTSFQHARRGIQFRADPKQNPMSFDNDSLPKIPGGWRTHDIDVGDRTFAMILPVDPDAFLDDETVIERNLTSDYMPYWAYLWPVAELMAKFVLDRDWPAEARTLEIGSGVGLVGLAGLAAGLDVTFSDYDDVAVEVVLRTAKLNGFRHARSRPLDWKRIPDDISPFDIVLGCDVIYESGNHALVLNVLDRLLDPTGECWIGDPGRQLTPAFRLLAIKRGYDVSTFDMSGIRIDQCDDRSAFPVSVPRLLKLQRRQVEGHSPT